MSDIKSFMASDAGASARYTQRRKRRVRISIDDIEPQSKKMSAVDRTAFQAAVAEQLTSVKRSTFRGDVALKLDLATASKSPPHAHTIAKNLLGPVPVLFRSSESDALFKGDRIWQLHTATSSSVMRFGSRSPAA